MLALLLLQEIGLFVHDNTYVGLSIRRPVFSGATRHILALVLGGRSYDNTFSFVDVSLASLLEGRSFGPRQGFFWR